MELAISSLISSSPGGWSLDSFVLIIPALKLICWNQIISLGNGPFINTVTKTCQGIFIGSLIFFTAYSFGDGSSCSEVISLSTSMKDRSFCAGPHASHAFLSLWLVETLSSSFVLSHVSDIQGQISISGHCLKLSIARFSQTLVEKIIFTKNCLKIWNLKMLSEWTFKFNDCPALLSHN